MQDVLQVEKPVDSMAKKECQGAEQGAAVMDAPMSMLEMGAALEEGTQSLPEDSEEDERSALEAPPVLSCDDLVRADYSPPAPCNKTQKPLLVPVGCNLSCGIPCAD